MTEKVQQKSCLNRGVAIYQGCRPLGQNGNEKVQGKVVLTDGWSFIRVLVHKDRIGRKENVQDKVVLTQGSLFSEFLFTRTK